MGSRSFALSKCVLFVSRSRSRRGIPLSRLPCRAFRVVTSHVARPSLAPRVARSHVTLPLDHAERAERPPPRGSARLAPVAPAAPAGLAARAPGAARVLAWVAGGLLEGPPHRSRHTRRSSRLRHSSPLWWRSWRAWPSPPGPRRRPAWRPAPSGWRSCSRPCSRWGEPGSASGRSRRSSGCSCRPSRGRRSGAARRVGCLPSSWRSRWSWSRSSPCSSTWTCRRSPARSPSSCSSGRSAWRRPGPSSAR